MVVVRARSALLGLLVLALFSHSASASRFSRLCYGALVAGGVVVVAGVVGVGVNEIANNSIQRSMVGSPQEYEMTREPHWHQYRLEYVGGYTSGYFEVSASQNPHKPQYGNWAMRSDPVFLAVAKSNVGTPIFLKPNKDLRSQLAVSRDLSFFEDHVVKFEVVISIPEGWKKITLYTRSPKGTASYGAANLSVPEQIGDSEKDGGVRLTRIE